MEQRQTFREQDSGIPLRDLLHNTKCTEGYKHGSSRPDMLIAFISPHLLRYSISTHENIFSGPLRRNCAHSVLYLSTDISSGYLTRTKVSKAKRLAQSNAGVYSTSFNLSQLSFMTIFFLIQYSTQAPTSHLHVKFFFCLKYTKLPTSQDIVLFIKQGAGYKYNKNHNREIKNTRDQ